MVVPSEHANPDGNIESAIFYGFDFNQNKNTVVPKRTNLTRELWLEKVLEPSTFESHAQKYPVSNTVPSRRNRSSDRPSSSARSTHTHKVRSTRTSEKHRSRSSNSSNRHPSRNKNNHRNDEYDPKCKKFRIVAIK